MTDRSPSQTVPAASLDAADPARSTMPATAPAPAIVLPPALDSVRGTPLPGRLSGPARRPAGLVPCAYLSEHRNGLTTPRSRRRYGSRRSRAPSSCSTRPT